MRGHKVRTLNKNTQQKNFEFFYVLYSRTIIAELIKTLFSDFIYCYPYQRYEWIYSKSHINRLILIKWESMHNKTKEKNQRSSEM